MMPALACTTVLSFKAYAIPKRGLEILPFGGVEIFLGVFGTVEQNVASRRSLAQPRRLRICRNPGMALVTWL